MKRWVLSRHDSQELIAKVQSTLARPLELPKSSQASCVEPADGVVFVRVEDKFVFVKRGEDLLPFLGSQETLELFPAAKVDEGAIKFMLNGADVMRPGVRSYDEWGEEGRTVVVREDKKGRGIAVGKALVNSGAMAVLSKGPCIKNLHHVGDRFWTLYKEV
jgi:PUA domain protein